MAKRILVPLDQSTESEAVVELVEGRVLAYADQEATRLEVEALDYLRAVEVQLDGVPVEYAVRFGDPLREILLEADAFGADLIAVTARARRGIGRVIRRGVARRIFCRARVPVLVFRSALEQAA